MRTLVRGLALIVFVAMVNAVSYQPAQAQTLGYLYAYGTPTFTAASPVEMGFVNLANGDLHLEIPIISLPQRGAIPYSAKLVYDSRIWFPTTVWSPANVLTDQGGASQGGWRFVTTADGGNVTYGFSQDTCDPTGVIDYYGPFYWTEPTGAVHTFNINTRFAGPNCGVTSIQGGDAFATDSSGYHMHIPLYHDAIVYSKDGTIVHNNTAFFETQDTNGNNYTRDANGNIVDTLNRTPITVSTVGNQTTYTVKNSQGTSENYVVTTTTVNYNSAFTQSGVTNVSGGLTAIQKIQLPDGTSYTFGYDSGTTSGHYGVLTSMTLPTGGTINYGYTTFTDAASKQNRWLSSRTSGGGTWNYTPASASTGCQTGNSGCQKVTVIKPSTDQTIYTFSLFSTGAWNTQTLYYTGSTTLLKTVSTTFDFAHGSNVVPTQVVETMPVSSGNVNKQTQYSYDSSTTTANVSAVKEWNLYTGSPSASPNRETDTTYVTNANYTARYINNRPLTITVKNGTGTQLAKTTYTYDSTTIGSMTGITHHDDTGFGTGMPYRGNPTVMSKWVSASSSPSETKYYDMTGQLTKLTDMNLHDTTYGYTDNFYTDSSNPSTNPTTYTSAVPTNAYLKTKTLPVIGTETYGYYFNSGQRALFQDQNAAITYTHHQDSLDRLTSTTYPPINNGSSKGWSLTVYTSSTQHDTYKSINDTTPSSACSSCAHQMMAMDDMGRMEEQAMMSDPGGADKSDTSYDTTSHIQTQSNPYRGTSANNGTDTMTYDGLDRVLTVSHADGNVRHTYYGGDVSGHGGIGTQLCSTATYGVGYPALFLDEAGKKRQLWQDAYKRVIEVDEPDSSNGLTVATCYTYDVLNDLTSVVQGTETRTYSYDGLSRKSQEVLPESGTTTYYYTTSTGSLCSGDAESVCRRTDARGITTTYSYDAANRLMGKTYSDTTSAVSFSYDQASYNGLTITNGKGRRTGMSDGSGITAWSYDAAGNLLTELRTIAGTTKTTSYTYTLANQVATIAYPSGHTITYTYDNADHQSSVIDSSSGINYATSATYDPTGALASAVHGQVTGGFAGITRTYTYDTRLQPSTMVVSSSAGTVQNFTYSYDLGSGVDNGNVVSITNNLNTSRTESFTYDNLNRLATAQSQATSGTYCWGETYTYDRWGNLYSRGTQKVGTGCVTEPLALTVNSNNQLTGTGISYDNAGNLTNDGSHAYTWDAENKLSTGGGSTYTYDADGWRRKSSGGRLFWTEKSCSHPILAETDLSGNTPDEYVYLAGRRIAWRSNGTVYYLFDDHLGSTRVVTNSTGVLQDDSDYYPFGGELAVSNTIDNRYKFSGKRRDTETGLDYSLYREFYPNWGRWLSQDPIQGTPGDPQTQDLYSYVRNNAINLSDSLGNVFSSHCLPPGGGVILASAYGLVPYFPDLGSFLPGSADNTVPDYRPMPLCVDGAWDGASLLQVQVVRPRKNCTCSGPGGDPNFLGACTYTCTCEGDFVPGAIFSLRSLQRACGWKKVTCPHYLEGYLLPRLYGSVAGSIKVEKCYDIQ